MRGRLRQIHLAPPKRSVGKHLDPRSYLRPGRQLWRGHRFSEQRSALPYSIPELARRYENVDYEYCRPSRPSTGVGLGDGGHLHQRKMANCEAYRNGVKVGVSTESLDRQLGREGMEQSTTLPWRQQQFRAFWSGPPLSVYEELSLASFVARGQQVIVYSYDRSLRVPQGVELADANEIMPGGRIYEFVHPWGERTPALHSDLFRYELLRRLGDWYFDLDVVLLRDSPPECSIYLGREDEAIINGAVMRLPPGLDHDRSDR